MSNGDGDKSKEKGATVAGNAPAKVQAFPPEYWNYASLSLDLNSIDDAGAKKYNKKATAPLTYVQDLQKDLITLGYLKAGGDDGFYGGSSKRAVTQFQRHAKRIYRLIGSTKKSDDVSAADTFSGSVNGVCNQATATEIRKWIGKGWVVAVGRFPLKNLSEGGRLREDAADAWEKIITAVAAKGGTVAGPYGDTTRPLVKTDKVGASKFSFHYCGRAVDINQAFANLTGRRYFIAKDPAGSDTFWIIYCKTDKQDGTQGTKFNKGDKTCWEFGDEKEFKIPEGYYINLTDEIQATNMFERIKAQDGWDDKTKFPEKAHRYNKTEWWHFQYKVDKQETFQDEVELIGFAEADLRAKGWDTDAMLDHKPG